MIDKEIVIGIDLGTTFSCVAAVVGGKPVVLEDQGRKITPSYLAFPSDDPRKRIVGEEARRQQTINPQNTFFVTKRFMGLGANEALKMLKDHPLPYKVQAGKNGRAEFVTTYNHTYSPEQSAAAILSKMKNIAATALAVPETAVKKAVVTVPAYFNDDQRQATKDAGKIAGLDVIRIINEPTAAALAYGLDKKKSVQIVVFDLGGGTFDVSCLSISDNFFETKASVGDPFLGGADFDQRIINYVLDDFKKTSGVDLSKDKQAVSRIREEAEKAKIALSTTLSTQISIPFITTTSTGPLHIDVTLTRAKYESICEDLFQRTKQPCLQVLKDAGNLSPSDIDEIVLVGGMTRTPRVEEIVKEVFGKAPLKNLNPDEAVAMGAAIQGAIIAGTIGADVVMLDVTPMSLGIETAGGVFTPIISKQTTIPIAKSQEFSTYADNQTSVSINVFQGERPFVKDNKLLGNFTLEGIAPAPRGVPRIEVKFDIDVNGMVHVTAIDKGTGKSHKITIESSKMTEEEIQKHMEEVRLHEEEDKKKLKVIEAKNKAEQTMHSAEKTVSEYKDKIDGAKIEEVNKLKSDLSEAIKEESLEKIESLEEQLSQLIQQIGTQIHQQGQSQQGPSGPSQPGEETAQSSNDQEVVVE